MTTSARRSDALSRARVVAAAIGILDTGGEAALTFRALAAELSTGAGALYGHVAGKDDLLAAATQDVVDRALRGVGEDDPREAVRSVALAVHDALDAHPWVGTQLAQEPWQPAALAVFEAFGCRLDGLGVPEAEQLDAASALLSQVLGLAGQHAAALRLVPRGTDRTTFLAGMTGRWAQLDAQAHPFLHRVAAQVVAHDDRAQLLAGVDLVLAGLAARR